LKVLLNALNYLIQIISSRLM